LLHLNCEIVLAQGGVDDPGMYKKGMFSVVDCFKKSQFLNTFKADSLAPNYILKGQRIWRSVSLDNKQNQILLNTNNECAVIGLFEIIKFGLFEKKLNAFSSDDFNQVDKYHLNENQLIKCIQLNDSVLIKNFDALGNEKEELIGNKRYLFGSDIKSYLIKEDWIFNSQSGKSEKYIIAIAPLIYDSKTEKVIPLFWLYYPEWKNMFALFEAKNFYSFEKISYDDVFTKRYFVSIISKESNVFDRTTKAYKHGNDAYLESELIKEKLMNSEMDLFQY
jgi:gliding motility associated protien GldN